MPYPSFFPGRAGGVVPRIRCWRKAARCRRLLAGTLGPTHLLSTSKSPGWWLLAFGLGAAQTVAAQGTAALRGTVADSLSGQPLAGVSVGLVGQPGGAATDALGQFRLAGLRPGTYALRVGTMGYKVKNQLVTLVAGETRGLAISLATTQLNLAEVTVSQPRDPNQTLAAISHIDQTLRPLNSAQDLLRLVPGLFIAQHAGGGKAEQIFVRGFDADHGTDFAVSIDGLPVNMV
ncbi:MAG: TonB-dependent receptor, partial [Cytophagaceae bacterium]